MLIFQRSFKLLVCHRLASKLESLNFKGESPAIFIDLAISWWFLGTCFKENLLTKTSISQRISIRKFLTCKLRKRKMQSEWLFLSSRKLIENIVSLRHPSKWRISLKSAFRQVPGCSSLQIELLLSGSPKSCAEQRCTPANFMILNWIIWNQANCVWIDER